MKPEKDMSLAKKGPFSRLLAAVSHNFTIRYKLVLIIMLTCVATLVIAGAIFTGYQWRTLRRVMVMNLLAQAGTTAETCKAAVVFNDVQDAQETLSSLAVVSSVVFGGIYDNDQNLMAAYYCSDVSSPRRVQPDTILQDGYMFSDDYLTVFEKIVLDGEKIGTVCIRSNLEPLRAMLLSSIKITFLIVSVSLLAAFLISSRLQSVVSRPILELAELARIVSEGKDYTVRGTKTDNDEIGLLIDGFNEMLDQIQRRDQALVAANKELEAKVAKRTADLEQMVEKLNASNKQLQEFTYVASHDLREPMRKISSFGELLQTSLAGKIDADDAENLSYMIDGASRMQQMIEALLTYSRVSTQGAAFKPVDLNEVIDQLRSFELSVKLEETNTQLKVPEPLHKVNCDPAQMRQLLQNLIANGLKYQKKGNTPQITIRSGAQDGSMIRVEVQDNGIGIKQEQFKDLFIMFRRLHSRQEYEGTGIGLAVCKKIVERHGGEIGVSSTYGEGSVFWFTAPTAGTSRTQTTSAVGSEIEI